ncbi:unnamed protein product [Arctogadus glacialis]
MGGGGASGLKDAYRFDHCCHRGGGGNRTKFLRLGVKHTVRRENNSSGSWSTDTTNRARSSRQIFHVGIGFARSLGALESEWRGALGGQRSCVCVKVKVFLGLCVGNTMTPEHGR